MISRYQIAMCPDGALVGRPPGAILTDTGADTDPHARTGSSRPPSARRHRHGPRGVAAYRAPP